MQIFLFLTVILKCGVNGISSAAEMICSHMPGLTSMQRELCKSAPQAMVAVGQGYRLAISECQYHFSQHRWNCTPIGNKNSFGHVVVVGSREAAFTYGVTSAGVAYMVAVACARGNITSCGCGSYPATAASWKWAGCSVDLNYGLTFARRFLDAREIDDDPRTVMNLHNNRAGRTAVRRKMFRECKCHGVSGSCTMRTCWRALPPFRQITDHLKFKYWRAKAVQLMPERRQGVQKIRKRALQTKKGKSTPRKSDLVYLQPSPNYCERDLAAGSLGTEGRECNRSSADLGSEHQAGKPPESQHLGEYGFLCEVPASNSCYVRSFSGTGGCDLLCCGRGYSTHQVVKNWQCNCTFHWCCYVECEVCSQTTQIYTCN